MTVRKPGCRDCEGLTGGDCGKHGPVVVRAHTEITIPTEVVWESDDFTPFTGPKGLCMKCGLRRATTWWASEGGTMALVRGWAAPWCLRCCVVEQLRIAHKMVERIPKLEAELAELDAAGGE